MGKNPRLIEAERCAYLWLLGYSCAKNLKDRFHKQFKASGILPKLISAYPLDDVDRIAISACHEFLYQKRIKARKDINYVA